MPYRRVLTRETELGRKQIRVMMITIIAIRRYFSLCSATSGMLGYMAPYIAETRMGIDAWPSGGDHINLYRHGRVGCMAQVRG